ncbi:MAG: hypothetical protein IT376_23550 [Polyangiaceae bacterium]|nr:hypothetical protein [Polyangiaceae bacterium]
MPEPPGAARPSSAWRSVALAAAGAVLAVTCSGARLVPGRAPSAAAASEASAPSRAPAVPSAAPPGASAASSDAVGAGASAAASVAPPASAAAAIVPPPARSGPLARFQRRLDELRSGAARRPLRVAWLGDSHTAADFLTDAVRVALWREHPAGGPGFLPPGIDGVRHARASIAVRGKVEVEPRERTSSERQLDGAFGLLGLRGVPASDDARVTLTPTSGAGALAWELSYRAPAGRFRVRYAGHERDVDGSSGSADAQDRTLRRLRFEAPAGVGVELGGFRGRVELLGVVVEARDPGVVLDTLGINGARATTALAWDEAHWTAELERRAPALVVLAYGTNDVASNLALDRYPGQYARLLARARKAAPGADCLLVGPTDLGRTDGTAHPRTEPLDRTLRGVAEAEGCAWFSLYDAMGGATGMSDWLGHDPPLAARDRVHLTARGYERLGAALGALLLGAPRPE